MNTRAIIHMVLSDLNQWNMDAYLNIGENCGQQMFADI